MRGFKVYLEDTLYEDFYIAFPDHGERTSVIRKCVRRVVNKVKKEGGILPKDIEEIASTIAREKEELEPCS